MTIKQKNENFGNAKEWFEALDEYAADDPFIFDREQLEASERW